MKTLKDNSSQTDKNSSTLVDFNYLTHCQETESCSIQNNASEQVCIHSV